MIYDKDSYLLMESAINELHPELFAIVEHVDSDYIMFHINFPKDLPFEMKTVLDTIVELFDNQYDFVLDISSVSSGLVEDDTLKDLQYIDFGVIKHDV